MQPSHATHQQTPGARYACLLNSTPAWNHSAGLGLPSSDTGRCRCSIVPVARFLISAFGSDAQVSDSLRIALLPGWWVGDEAAGYERLIDRLRSWVAVAGEPSEVVAWTHTTLEWLEPIRDAASERDAHPGW
jgi:hypothetical protein